MTTMKKSADDEKTLKDLMNPLAANRIRPFWFWNGEMKEEEIETQIREMADKGLGGAFVCARQGLALPYLSSAWFERVDFAKRCAEAYGLELWLYDEYPYPSGMAGGEVLLRHPEAEYKYLVHQSFRSKGGEERFSLGRSEILCCTAYPIRDGKLIFEEGLDLRDAIGNLQREEIYQTTGLTAYNRKRFFSYRPEHVLTTKLPEGEWQIEVYGQKALGEFKYYGKFFDPCNPEAVQTFIELTHEGYRRKMGGDFGRSVKGMFSDEVGLLSPIPWSQYLPAYFKKTRGQDIKGLLPALHHADFPDAYSIRYALFSALHELFVESYHKQVASWCDRHQLMYATEVPSMRMSTQRYSHVPGGDCAHEKIGKSLDFIYDKYLPQYRSNAKAVSSLARQLDRPYAMIESFHSVGWSMTIQDAKWMLDRLAANGINFYNFHAFFYTIAGLAKHDAPPSQFLQNPYWDYYKGFADYAGRLSRLITDSEALIRIAVLDPLASLWLFLGNPFHSFPYAGEDENEKAALGKVRGAWVDLCKALLFRQIDYDHLDTEIMREGTMEDGRLRIGRAAYGFIILPPTPFLESEAFESLGRFVKGGGTLIICGDWPAQFADKNEAIDWSALREEAGSNLKHFPEADYGRLASYLKDAGSVPFLYEGQAEALKNIVQSSRRDGQYRYTFAANQGEAPLHFALRPADESLELLYEIDLLSGKKKTSRPDPAALSLEGFESRLWVWGGDRRKQVPEAEKQPEILLRADGLLPFKTEGPNIFRLEDFSLSRDGGEGYLVEPKIFIEQAAEVPVIQGDELAFSDGFGLPKKIAPAYPLEVFYTISFQADYLPDSVLLLMDKGALSGRYRLSVNGTLLPPEAFSPHFIYDHNNLAAEVRPYLQTGGNRLQIRMSIRKNQDGLRDPLYLAGDFGVEFENGTAYITKPRAETFFRTDYTPGYPFYSGKMAYETGFSLENVPEKAVLRLDPALACRDAVEAVLNGRSLGARTFAPYTWPVKKELLKKGRNQVRIIRANTLVPMLEGAYFSEAEHRMKKIRGQ